MASTVFTIACARSESTAASKSRMRSGRVTVTGRLGSANFAGRPGVHDGFLH